MIKYISWLVVVFFCNITPSHAQYADLIFDFKTELNPSTSTRLVSAGDYYRYQIVDSGTYGSQVRIFVPPGTVQIASNILVVSPVKAIWRWATQPTTSIATVSGEALLPYGTSLITALLTGQDVVFSTNNPGMLPFDTGSGGLVSPLQTGAYAYINLAYSSSPTFTSTLIVNKACYDKWYSSASTKWVNGNPDPSATHTCDGSTGGVVQPQPVVTPLTGIGLTTDVLIPGVQTEAAISAVPSDASLGVCTLSNTTYATVDSSTQKVKLNAVASGLASTVSVDLICTGNSTLKRTVTIRPSGPVITYKEMVDAVTKLLAIDVTIDRPTNELILGSKVDVWVAARIPARWSYSEMWFFLAPDNSWQLFDPTKLNTFASIASELNRLRYKSETDIWLATQPAAVNPQVISFPTGFSVDSLRMMGAEIHMADQIFEKDFRSFGKVWPK